MAKDKRVEEIIKRIECLFAEKNFWTPLWQELADYVLPRKNKILIRSSKKDPPRIQFDSTAPHAAQLLASSLHGAFETSKFRIEFEDDDLNEDEDAMAWLEDATKRYLIMLALSNNRTSTSELFLDMVVFGTSAQFSGEKRIKQKEFNGFKFQTFPIQDYAIEVNSDEVVDTFCRTIEYTPRQAIQAFGDMAGKSAIQKYKENKQTCVTYLQIIHPKEECEFDIKDGYEFADIIVSRDDKTLVRAAGHEEFPITVPRWSTVAGDPWGYGVSLAGIGDIRLINKMKELNLQALTIDINPPKFEPEGISDVSLKWGPNAKNENLRPELIAKIRTITSEARTDILRINIADLVDSIRKIHYTDQLQIQKQAQMTATEATYTYELMQRLTGPHFGRTEEEYQTKKIKRGFNMMWRASVRSGFTDTKAFLPPPPGIAGMKDIKIKYSGPLTRAQEQNEAKAVQEWLALVSQLTAMYPVAGDVPNIVKCITDIGIAMGVPREKMNSTNEMKKLKEEREQRMQQMQEMEAMEKGAKMMPNISKMMENEEAA